MKLGHLYKQVIKLGNDRDPRKPKGILSYADSAILHGSPGKEIRKILVGIDIEAPEILLADRIREREGLDLVIAHHPEGRAYASLAEVMRMQVDLLKGAGIQESVARQLIEERQDEVARRILPQNHMRAVDVARILDMAFMCVHTPADNHVSHYIQGLLSKKKPRLVGGILKALKAVPEYRRADSQSSGPRIILGNPRRPVGKIFVEMTGGTEGSKDSFDKLHKAGVRTLVCMHLSDEHFKKVKDTSLNVIIAGHISSDNLGLNLLLDRLEKQEKFQIIGCSGFYRIKR